MLKRTLVLALAAVGASSMPATVAAQVPAEPATAEPAAPPPPAEAVVPVQVAADRPTITVTDFDYGTVAAQIAGDKKTRKRLEKMGIKDGAAFSAAMGVGAADLIVEKLLATGAYRVLERKQLTAVEHEQRLADGADPSAAAPRRVTRARYIVSGSVTRLGFEEKNLGGAAGTAASFALYGLGAKKNRTEVHLTARVIDTETGEIIASFTGEGESSKGWGLTVFGIGGGGFGGATAGSSNIRESAIGEATERAAQNIAERIVAAKSATATH